MGSNKIVIIGAGGFGREVLWLIESLNKAGADWDIAGFIDDGVPVQTVVNGIPVIGDLEYLRNYTSPVHVACAIGSTKIRKSVVSKLLENKNLIFPNLIEPSVMCSQYAKLGVGNIICAGNILTVNIEIGDFNIINLSCTLGHDDILESFVTIYPGVNVSGNVKIGELAEVGTGTKIIQGKIIGSGSVIGAGSVVVKDVPMDCTAVGVPAKVIKGGGKEGV